jgi:hypothetical protein
MAAKTWDTRAEMRDYLRELLTRLASKYAKKPEINLILDLQSRLVPDEVDEDAIGQVMLSISVTFDRASLVLE